MQDKTDFLISPYLAGMVVDFIYLLVGEARARHVLTIILNSHIKSNIEPIISLSL